MFAKRLNETRKSRGLTAKATAEHLNIEIRSYRNYESGHREPSLENLVKIADFFQVSTDYLLGREDSFETLRKTR